METKELLITTTEEERTLISQVLERARQKESEGANNPQTSQSHQQGGYYGA